MKTRAFCIKANFLATVTLAALTILTSGFVPHLEALPGRVPFPADNPPTKAKILLGRRLFFDHSISVGGRYSCASCHDLQSGGGNHASDSIKPGGKHSRHAVPSVYNAAFLPVLFWYGSAKSLEEQAEGPLTEMGMGDPQAVIKNIAAISDYVSVFEKIFGEKNSVSLGNLTKALASYERTLVTPDSAFDRFMKGNERALSSSAREGLVLFRKIGCVQCHNGPDFAGPTAAPGSGQFKKFPLYRDSLYEVKYRLAEDPGRFQITQDPKDQNIWRVSPLRNVVLMAPYFHNGSVTTLQEAVRVMAKTELNLDLNDQAVEYLTEFLKSLTGKRPPEDWIRPL